MPKREDETWLNLHPHQPTCNCANCCKVRDGRIDGEKSFILCPACNYYTLSYNVKKGRYICFNKQCQTEGETLTGIKDNHSALLEKLDAFPLFIPQQPDKGKVV